MNGLAILANNSTEPIDPGVGTCIYGFELPSGSRSRLSQPSA
ncbi:hypothetical protein SAMN04488693_107103 [Arthrobacter subterraneus]|uniref:Uncharacterized protein n=1 Tax=Arthrobacter subterraneus TaxID=335973 RepID=A0A1G8IQZ0_9MICC|nr:hypothetical protein SAMN04488693_107103 [Arthrobacter subterraneus]